MTRHLSQSAIRRAPSIKPAFAGVRRHPRKTIAIDVVIQDEDGWEIPMTSVDVSQGGVFVRSNVLFDVGDTYTLIFTPSGSGRIVRVGARVVRVVEGNDSSLHGADLSVVPGMAFEFIEFAHSAREQLGGMVAGA